MVDREKLSFGVTLIELLIVISIVTLLFSIILVSTMNARNTARDARIQVSLDQIRSIAEKYRLDHGNYDNFFVGDISYSLLRQDIVDMGGIPNSSTASDKSGYCIYSKMNNGKYCCVDNKFVYKCYDTEPSVCGSGCEAANNCACE